MYSLPNEHGVYGMDQCETVEGNGVDWRVRIHLAHPNDNDWRVAVNVNTGHDSMGSLPCIHDRVHTTRVGAFYAGLEMTMEWFQERGESYTCTEGDHRAVEKALAWCRMRLQLALF